MSEAVGRPFRPDRPIPVPPSKSTASKAPTVASSAPAGPLIPKDSELDIVKARSSAPTSIEVAPAGSSRDDPLPSPKLERGDSIPVISASSSPPPPLQLQTHRRRPEAPQSPPPFRPLPSTSPRIASAGLPSPHSPPTSPPGSRISDSTRRLPPPPVRSPRNFTVGEVTLELLAAEARESELMDADHLAKAMKEAKELQAAAEEAARGSSQPAFPRPSSQSSPPAPVPTPSPVSQPPSPPLSASQSSVTPAFVPPKKTLPVAPKRAATNSNIVPTFPNFPAPTSPHAPTEEPLQPYAIAKSSSSSSLSHSDGVGVPTPPPERRSSDTTLADAPMSPPLSPSSHDSHKWKSDRMGMSQLSFRKIREKAKEGLEKTKEMTKEATKEGLEMTAKGLEKTREATEKGLEKTAKLKDTAVFQEIKKFGATAGARINDWVSPEDEANNAIAEHRETIAQPAKALSPADKELLEKSGPLCQVLAKHNWLIARTLASCLGRDENEKLAKALGPLLSVERPPLRLLRLLINDEVEKTKEAPTLFRGNTFSSAMLSVYQRHAAQSYLHAVMQPMVKEIIAYKHSFELNPEALKETDSLEQNMVFLEVYVDKFVATIVRSLDLYPTSLRHLCKSLVEALGTRFESARHIVLAGFFFLRFICPSIIAPEGYDLLESGDTISPVVRRNLVILSKVLQNIANNAQFTNMKEAFMAPLNPVVLAHQPVIQSFLMSMATPVGPAAEELPPGGAPHPDLRGITYLHSQLHLHLMKLQGNLEAAMTKESVEDENLLDELLGALAVLPPGPPPARSASESPSPTPPPAAAAASNT